MSYASRCWMSSVAAARIAHGGDSLQHKAALDHPCTCLLPLGHSGPHAWTFDGDVVFEPDSDGGEWKVRIGKNPG